MATKFTFNRLEKKFLLNEEQYLAIKKEIDLRFDPDEWGETTICNLYYDTPTYLLITRSIEKPVYKEKLRLRTYGIPTDESLGFIEVKKKYKGVVYKRRMRLPLKDAVKFLADEIDIEKPTQISKEMKYFLRFYDNIEPRFYLSYDRSAFFHKDDKNFRITFDRNLTWRNYDLDLTKGSYGESLLPPDKCVLMEIKVPTAIPLWLTSLLSDLKVYTRSFSKVGNAFNKMITNNRSYLK